MAPILYHQDVSPPSRAVRIVAAALNIPLELKTVNLLTKEHLEPEFVKINPQHTLPCLNDNGFVVWDSHVIIAYLIDKYVKEDTSLYPRDLKLRATINQRCHFDTGVLFAKLRQLFVPILYKGSRELNPTVMKEIEESYEFIESFLKNNDYLCGSNITIADISCATTVTMLKLVVPVGPQFPKTLSWLKRVTSYPPYVQEDVVGQDNLVKALQSMFGDKIHA